MHRFPVERVALCKAALQVASDAEAAAAGRCVPLLRDAASRAGVSSSREALKQQYAAVRAVGMWGGIKTAVRNAERAMVMAEAALGAAVEGAEGAVERLEKVVDVPPP